VQRQPLPGLYRVDQMERVFKHLRRRLQAKEQRVRAAANGLEERRRNLQKFEHICRRIVSEILFELIVYFPFCSKSDVGTLEWYILKYMIWVLAFRCWHCCQIWRKFPHLGEFERLIRKKQELNSSETSCELFFVKIKLLWLTFEICEIVTIVKFILLLD
jgi:hypothetical protein